tara:strand:- start:4310 stop:4990 length:681 start_codon:yes stop_codon:yes gene_type:complete
MTNKKKAIFGLFGTGGFAREVMPIAKETFIRDCSLEEVSEVDFVFVESDPKKNSINGYKLISDLQFIESSYEHKYFNIAVADSSVREQFSIKFENNNIQPLSITSKHSVFYEFNEISTGCIICANSIVTSNAKIGKYFHSNIYSYVAHDCVIGDFVTFAPRVNCNGNIIIEDHAYIGTGAILKQGIPDQPLVIGKGSIVGMGAVVTKNVPAYTTVIGNPAKVFDKT